MAASYKFSDKFASLAHPGDLRSDFCECVDEFITHVQSYKNHIGTCNDKDAVYVTENFTQFWRNHFERINYRWKAALRKNPRYEPGHIRKYTTLTRRDINKNTKIYCNATEAIFENDWVYIADLIVEYSSGIYENAVICHFRSSWRDFRHHIIDLWVFALEECERTGGERPATAPNPSTDYSHDHKQRAPKQKDQEALNEIFGYDKDKRPQASPEYGEPLQSARHTTHEPYRSELKAGETVGGATSARNSSRPAHTSHKEHDQWHPKETSLQNTHYDNASGESRQSGTHLHHQQIESLQKEIDEQKDKISALENSKARYKYEYYEIRGTAKSLEEENRKLNEQIDSYERSTKSAHHDTDIQQRDYDIQMLQKDKDRLQKQLQEKDEHEHDLQTKIRELQKSVKYVSALEERNKTMEREKATLMDQLSATMNRQMARDETDLENINVKNRPMKVLEEYELFCSQDWLDAKGDLDENAEKAQPHAPLSEGNRCALLCLVLDESYSCAEDIYNTHKSKLSQIIGQLAAEPLSVYKKHEQPSRSASTGYLDKDFEVCLSKMLKQTSDRADFTTVTRNLLEDIFKKQIESHMLGRDLLSSRHLQQYAASALSLCWRMVIQQPPMKLDSHSLLGNPMPESGADPHFGSTDPKKPTAFVQYYVYPAVFHGENQMKKARVFLGDSEKELRRARGSQYNGGSHRSTYSRKSAYP